MKSFIFPNTNLVECKFAFRQSNYDSAYNEYDCLDDEHIKRLKSYVYRLPDYMAGELDVGDTVLVHCQTGYQICMVTKVNATSGLEESKIAPVICKVDLSQYFAEIENKKRLKAMKTQIDKEKKRLEAMVTYEMIAEKHPEFKKMLDTFKEAGGEL